MTLELEIDAFSKMKPDLEKHHMGKFVVIRDAALVGAFDTLESAAATAVQSFGRGPYLIKQVGSAEPHLPVSLMYRPAMAMTHWTGNANS